LEAIPQALEVRFGHISNQTAEMAASLPWRSDEEIAKFEKEMPNIANKHGTTMAEALRQAKFEY